MKLIKYWGPTLLLVATIFYLSSRQRVKISDVYAVQFLFFKSLHVIEYGALYTLVYRSIKNTSSAALWEVRLNSFLFTFVYAMSDEIHQVFVPTRDGRFRDIMIDLIGISISFYFIWKLLPKAPKKLKSWAKKLDLL